MTKVLVAGFFESIHSGHLNFLEAAQVHGDLYVSIGSDDNYFHFKDTYPLSPQQERARLVQALACVKEAKVSDVIGELDFEGYLKSLQPDKYIINRDGDTQAKRICCEQNGVEYVVLDYGHQRGDKAASADPLRLQYRLCLAGGWLDQPFVSKYYPGGVVVVSLKPAIEYMDRAGMATSTRKHARMIWNEHIPSGNYENVAKLLFGAENPPGKKEVAGSQDAIGLVYPGLSMPYYEGEYWPTRIENNVDPDVMAWLNQVLHLVPSFQRGGGYDPLAVQNLSGESVKQLADSADLAWEGALKKDIEKLGAGLKGTYEAYEAIFPCTIPSELAQRVALYQDCPGYNVTGAGGGGYIIVVSDSPVKDEVPLEIRG